MELKKADLDWGPNKRNITIPDFPDIYKEHMVDPFIVNHKINKTLQSESAEESKVKTQMP
jgi:hypothetical protein